VKRRFRLTGSDQFQRVRQSGRAIRLPLLIMVYLRSSSSAPRIGVIAGRAVGKAVQRNRAKRLLRHAIKPFISEIQTGWDILLIARKPLLEATFEQIREAIGLALSRANILAETDELTGN